MVRKKEKYIVPCIASYCVPGLGQMLKGEMVKGTLILVAFIISTLLMFVVIGFLTTPIIYIWQIVDAYRKQIKE